MIKIPSKQALFFMAGLCLSLTSLTNADIVLRYADNKLNVSPSDMIIKTLHLFDLSGRQILNSSSTIEANQNVSLTAKNIKTGYYFLEITGDNFAVTRKLFLTNGAEIFITPKQLGKLNKSAEPDINSAGSSVTAHSSAEITDSKSASKSFSVTIKNEADYAIAAWAEGLAGTGFDVYIDKSISASGVVRLDSTGWQKALAMAKGANPKYHLTIGTHSITFTSRDNAVPLIDYVELSTDGKTRMLDGCKKQYQSYIGEIEQNVTTKEAPVALSKTAAALATPLTDYQFDLDQSYTYTYRRTFSFTAGQTVTFETKKTDCYAVLPAMFLYNSLDLTKGSWFATEFPCGYMQRFTVTIQYTGSYTLLLTTYLSSRAGTVDLWKDGALFAANVPVAGNWYETGTKTGVLNYFTAKSTGDPWLWVLNNGFLVKAHSNNYYSGTGDFVWSWNARIKQDIPNSNWAIVSSYASAGAQGPGVCDVYRKCSNSDICPYFPNLKADDAIKSANATGTYNCISWSGGVAIEWIWPPTDSRWNIGGGGLVSFDNYYKNDPVIRYAGAIAYPNRVAPSTTGIEVDLWATGSGSSYNYTHGSVTKPGNDQAHGYDWESKPGGLTRTFHPRNALNGTGYGAVVYSYKRASGLAKMQAQIANGENQTVSSECAVTEKAKRLGITRPLSLDSSISYGLTTIRNVSFDDDEKNKSTALIAKIPSTLKDQFSTMYVAWQKTWDIPQIAILSNPSEYAKSAEYTALKDYCLLKGKEIWPLLFEKAQEDPPFIQILLEDVLQVSTLPEMQAVQDEFSGNQYTADGTFIYTTNKDRRISLCKKLLKNF